jgi:hypothetical protein
MVINSIPMSVTPHSIINNQSLISTKDALLGSQLGSKMYFSSNGDESTKQLKVGQEA